MAVDDNSPDPDETSETDETNNQTSWWQDYSPQDANHGKLPANTRSYRYVKPIQAEKTAEDIIGDKYTNEDGGLR